MKNQALFSSKDKSKKSKYHQLQFLFGALRVKNALEFWKIMANYIFSFEKTDVYFFPKTISCL